MLNIQDITKKYLSGLKMREIALEYGVSTQRIQQVLKKSHPQRYSNTPIFRIICKYCSKAFTKVGVIGEKSKYCNQKCRQTDSVKYKTDKERNRANDISHIKSIMRRYRTDEKFREHKKAQNRAWYHRNKQKTKLDNK